MEDLIEMPKQIKSNEKPKWRKFYQRKMNETVMTLTLGGENRNNKNLRKVNSQYDKHREESCQYRDLTQGIIGKWPH
mgnify:CR=1 FL=1